MRKVRVILCILGIVRLSPVSPAQQAYPAIPPAQLVREVVYNELQDHEQHGYWRYWIDRHSEAGETLEQQIETARGPVTLLALTNGQPPNQQARTEEQQRIRVLLNSPEEQNRHMRQYRQDEDRIGQIVALLPDAFLFDYDSSEDGCYRLRFRPNPDYAAHSIEARILHAMSGTIWIDARYKHLARLDGRIDQNVDFGYGVLGRLYKGGWFQLQRVRVGPDDWKTANLEMHMNVRALLVTSFARETSERRGGFAPVPPGTSLAEGLDLLERTPPPSPAPVPALAASVAPHVGAR
jgi:hypothetical protein